MLAIYLLAFLGIPEAAFVMIGKLAGGASAFVAIAGGIHRFIVRPIKTYWKQWEEYNVKMDKMAEKLSAISAEFYPNHGSSLRDAIDSLQRQIRFLDHQTKTILAHEDAGVFITNEAGECIWANGAYMGMTGRALEQILGKGWKNGIFAAHREKVLSEWTAAVADRREFDMYYSYEKPNGDEQPVHCTATKVEGKNGEMLGYVGYVTKGRKAQHIARKDLNSTT